MIKIAVVEDEENQRQQLQSYIARYAKEKGLEISVRLFSDGDEITENYDASHDIILMDIQMRFMDGMSAAEEIRKMDPDVIIMFITNMTDYAIRGYQVDALDYVLKPVSYFAFASRLDRAVARLGKKEDAKSATLTLRNGSIQKIRISDICYIESSAHVLIFHTAQGTFETYGKMKDCEEKFLPFDFFRSNKGYLVNLRHVDAVRDGCCIIGDDVLIISRARKKEFMEALAAYMGKL